MGLPPRYVPLQNHDKRRREMVRTVPIPTSSYKRLMANSKWQLLKINQTFFEGIKMWNRSLANLIKALRFKITTLVNFIFSIASLEQ